MPRVAAAAEAGAAAAAHDAAPAQSAAARAATVAAVAAVAGAEKGAARRAREAEDMETSAQHGAVRGPAWQTGGHFTCFTSTKVQILSQKALRVCVCPLGRHASTLLALLVQKCKD